MGLWEWSFGPDFSNRSLRKYSAGVCSAGAGSEQKMPVFLAC